MDLIKDPEYKQWLVDLKVRIRQSQLRAMIKVNDELLHLYWDLGYDIVIRQMDAKWGSGFYSQLSKELTAEFPEVQGFSATNLNYCKRFYQFYANDEQLRQQIVDEIHPQLEGKMQLAENKTNTIRPQLGGEFHINPIFSIPWGHQKGIVDKCKSVHEALFYVQKTIQNGYHLLKTLKGS